jgi:hypothetical protein
MVCFLPRGVRTVGRAEAIIAAKAAMYQYLKLVFSHASNQKDQAVQLQVNLATSGFLYYCPKSFVAKRLLSN